MVVLKALNRAVLAVAKVLVVILAALIASTVFISVVGRNFFNYSLEQVVEGNQILFMWMSFLGLIAVHAMNIMLKFELLEQRLPAGLHRVTMLCLRVLELVVALILLVSGWEMLDFAGSQYFNTMRVSYFWLYLPVPIAGLCVALKSVENILGLFSKGDA